MCMHVKVKYFCWAEWSFICWERVRWLDDWAALLLSSTTVTPADGWPGSFLPFSVPTCNNSFSVVLIQDVQWTFLFIIFLSLSFFYSFINEPWLKQIYSLVSARQHHLANKTSGSNFNQLIQFHQWDTTGWWFCLYLLAIYFGFSIW